MRWLDALHVLDSSLPTGAYVHSFGLEALSPGLDELQHALSMRLDQTIARLELVYVLHAYTDELVDLDERFNATQFTRETREASMRIGKNLLRSAASVFNASTEATPTPREVRLRTFLHDGRHDHHVVAFGAVAAALELPEPLAAEAYAFGALRGQVSAAQRLGWLGQRDAQRLLHALKPEIHSAAAHATTMELQEAGAFAPAWDIASMIHERSHARMFAS
jgi:urease accessory protein